ncbi:MAG: ectoine synthase [Proteobacteria bacterium]|nr:ectoine synthase [Pseudomonadota bacterium]
MFARTLDDAKAVGNVVKVNNGTGRSARYITAVDGMGFSYHLNWIAGGGSTELWYKNHWEANYIIEGTGKVTDLTTGESWALAPGSLYNVGPNDRHLFEVDVDERHASIFCPALVGRETHDADGAYSASGPVPRTKKRMFVRRADELRAAGKEMVVANGQARTIRMLTAADEMGFSFSDVHFDKGASTVLWYKNHWEANHIVEGSCRVEDLNTGESWTVEPGMLYNVGPKDRHRVTALTDLHYLSVFCPALRGDEQHDADGALEASGPVPPGPAGY